MWWTKPKIKILSVRQLPKTVRILDLGKVKTIADLKNLYVIRDLAPYTIKIRPHKDIETLLRDIEHLFVEDDHDLSS